MSVHNMRNCRIGLREVRAWIDAQPAQWRGAELWFVRAGLIEEVFSWWVNYTRGKPKVDGGRVPPLAMFFERPIDPNGLNVLLYHTTAGEFVVGHTCRVHPLYATDELPAADENNAANLMVAVRTFAKLPLSARPRVDLDVAEPTAAGDREKEPPTLLVVKWRKPLPSSTNEHGERAVAWSHRWIVRAHLRTLPNGRLTAVREHVKGPADRPLQLKARVDELRQ